MRDKAESEYPELESALERIDFCKWDELAKFCHECSYIFHEKGGCEWNINQLMGYLPTRQEFMDPNIDGKPVGGFQVIVAADCDKLTIQPVALEVMVAVIQTQMLADTPITSEN